MMRAKREAFSMMVALVVIIIMATVGAYVVSISSKNVHTTVVQYKREQAALLARSFTEFAIMAVSANDRNNTYSSGNQCLIDINSNNIFGSSDDGYHVQTRIYYIGDGGVSPCANTRQITSGMTTVESALSILVDVYVKYRMYDTNQTVTYHKRTLQKI